MNYLNHIKLKTKTKLTLEIENSNKWNSETKQMKTFISYCILTGGINPMRSFFTDHNVDLSSDKLKKLKDRLSDILYDLEKEINWENLK